MDNTEFENLLGEHISVAEEFLGDDFENTLLSKGFYYIPDEFIKKDFYGMQYNCITLQTNEEDIVQSVTIHLRKVINRQFFDSFIKRYGEPNYILVIENRQIISESVDYGDDDFKQNLRKSTFELREGSFEEDPLYIIWKKGHYSVKAFLRHNQNISEVTFSFPEEVEMIIPSNKTGQ